MRITVHISGISGHVYAYGFWENIGETGSLMLEMDVYVGMECIK